MSTIAKLDPSVRERRGDRRAQVRQMASDIHQYDVLIRRGERLHGIKPESRFMVGQLRQMRGVVQMAHDAIKKLCLDPRRTGAEKDAVLARLAGMTAKETVKSEGVFS